MLITYRFSYSKILKFSFFIRGANIDKIFTQVKNTGNFYDADRKILSCYVIHIICVSYSGFCVGFWAIH